MAATATTPAPVDRMVTRTLTVRFLTPSFLGGAEQSGQWRAPPFKHLLREWWRVAWAARHDPARWGEMRREEGLLFGNAWLSHREGKRTVTDHCRSLVRLRIDPWAPGRMRGLPATKPVAQRGVAAALYLGYGPVSAATTLKMDHPIDAAEQAVLSLAWPDDADGAALIEDTLALMNAFGTVGSRSRNGWGSFELVDEAVGKILPAPRVEDFARPWRECLRSPWPHAIGRDQDGKPLIWTTKTEHREWKAVIEELGRIRKAVNGLFRYGKGREVLSQPVAGRGRRMPSPLRFKVRAERDGKLRGWIFHLPCTPPPVEGIPERERADVWSRVHGLLDGDRGLARWEAPA